MAKATSINPFPKIAVCDCILEFSSFFIVNLNYVTSFREGWHNKVHAMPMEKGITRSNFYLLLYCFPPTSPALRSAHTQRHKRHSRKGNGASVKVCSREDEWWAGVGCGCNYAHGHRKVEREEKSGSAVLPSITQARGYHSPKTLHPYRNYTKTYFAFTWRMAFRCVSNSSRRRRRGFPFKIIGNWTEYCTRVTC
jgi:hypothetical protein